MRNQEILILGCPEMHVVDGFFVIIRLPKRLISTQTATNHPTDDCLMAIAASYLLAWGFAFYGSGDAVIGINPATR